MRLLILIPIFVCLLLSNCTEETRMFRRLTAKETGIDFTNEITEKDTANILDMEFVYNGGGVATGDVNGDGLPDLYFTGNQVDNRLYLNRGNLKFEDITQASGTGKPLPYQWSSGINMVDINCDGKLDIYVCNTINPDPEQRRNLLFINEGNASNGVPHFRESAKDYGLDDANQDSNAQFFDMDNDGDLDVFLAVNFIDHQYPNQYVTRTSDGSSPTRDLLLRNDWDSTLGHPVFKDISIEAGIVWAGYSHSLLIADFNEDGWQDVFVANDYLSNDLLFINDGAKGRVGHFTNTVASVLKHQAMSSMGSDLADVNNDAQPDFFVTEMQPWYNKRKKLFQGGSSYQTYLFNEQYRYEYQYTRNMLQMNQGVNPETQLPMFSEVGLFAGVQETDWSWTPILADFDNDGWRDLYITNGFPRDVTDHDFTEFRKSIASTITTKDELYKMIPQVKQSNFMFKNRLTTRGAAANYEDVTKTWGLSTPSFTNGAITADLDGDGDLDLVTNNIDDPAFVFENTSISSKKKAEASHYLRIDLRGSPTNPDAFGATVTAHFAGLSQKAVLMSARGYLSMSERIVHIGLGANTLVDSVVVQWPNIVGKENRRSVLQGVQSDQVLVVRYEDAQRAARAAALLDVAFREVAAQEGLRYLHEENDHIDFNFQRTLPHKFSQYGPCMAVGDVNGDGLEDIFIGGSSRYGQYWYYQQAKGGFKKDSVCYKTGENQKEEDSSCLLFDADNDLDLDLYIARGSGQHPANDPLYLDALYLNDGKGHFTYNSASLPAIFSNSSCVKAADFDRDGDLDLFVGSRMRPKSYPLADRSYILRNEGQARFVDVTDQIAPGLAGAGMVTDALWTDFNQDNLPDLVLTCEFSPIRFFQNTGGGFVAFEPQKPTDGGLSIAACSGWWNSLTAADLDNDGDIDYVAGNYGQNLYFQCSSKEPVRVYAKDFDNSGGIDPFISTFCKDSTGQKREYFYHPREDAVKQLVLIRKKFKTYGEFGSATAPQFFSPKELEGATILEAADMRTCVIENQGNGRFSVHPLPSLAQIAPVFGAMPYDIDGDGRLDLLLSGNDYGLELQQGRSDAFFGLALRNTGSWNFEPMAPQKSGFVIPAQGRGLFSLALGSGRALILAPQNRDYMKVFESIKNGPMRVFALAPNETHAVLNLNNGQKRAVEFCRGAGFSGHGGYHLILDSSVQSAAVYDVFGKMVRTLQASAIN